LVTEKVKPESHVLKDSKDSLNTFWLVFYSWK